MLKGIKLTLDIIAQVYNLRREKRRYVDIAEILNLSKTTISRYLGPGGIERHRKRRRERFLKGHRVNKRPYTGKCELCGENKGLLYYHHWDGHQPEIGLWLCFLCHMWAEGVEKGLEVKNYEHLKRRIVQEISG